MTTQRKDHSSRPDSLSPPPVREEAPPGTDFLAHRAGFLESKKGGSPAEFREWISVFGEACFMALVLASVVLFFSSAVYFAVHREMADLSIVAASLLVFCITYWVFNRWDCPSAGKVAELPKTAPQAVPTQEAAPVATPSRRARFAKWISFAALVSIATSCFADEGVRKIAVQLLFAVFESEMKRVFRPPAYQNGNSNQSLPDRGTPSAKGEVVVHEPGSTQENPIVETPISEGEFRKRLKFLDDLAKSTKLTHSSPEGGASSNAKAGRRKPRAISPAQPTTKSNAQKQTKSTL